ncbi:hypothetical protein F2Q70_00041082 [Brassica cretica]|uniref:Uncharacterized protein n=1 Tax=Brassica cretica TaxID=69181 RepID=A0A8S9K4L2_BRACR|nr:hypothetical protein F2Q70_00041082 [Brassica cretica]
MRVDSRRLCVIGFTQGETRGYLQIKASHGKNQKEYGFLTEVRGYEIRFCGNKRIDFEGIMIGMLRKEGVAVRVLTWWDLVRISWILVRIWPEQAHDCSYLIVIDDSKVCRLPGKGLEWFHGRTFRLFELYKDLLSGELSGLISFKRSVVLLFGVLQLDCDLDLIKLSVSSGSRQMRTRCVQCYRSKEVLTYWYKWSCHGTRQMQRIRSSFFGACLIVMETWFILTVVNLQGVYPRGGRSLNDVSLNTFKFVVVRFLLLQRREYYGALWEDNRVVKTRNHGNIFVVALDEGFFNKDFGFGLGNVLYGTVCDILVARSL